MKTIITVLAAVGLAAAGVIPAAPIVGHVATQYHAQDELGQYSYGYAGGPSAKEEIKTADGITRGGYSYVDGNGLVQSAAYVSDPVNGFRVAATNLPAGPAVPATPEVLVPAAVIPAAPAVPLLPSALAAAVHHSSVPLATPVESVNPLPSVVIKSAVSPITIQQESPAPVSETVAEENASTAEVPSSTDNLAQENQSTPQAEAAPESPVVSATIEQLVTPVQDTPEVLAAKAAHFAAFEEVKLRDAAQDAEDAKNNISTGDSEKNNSEEESTESAMETTDAPSSVAVPAAESVPASQDTVLKSAPAEVTLPVISAPQFPVYNSAPVSVVATQLLPAATPEVAPVVPSVLTKAAAAPVIQESLVAPVATSAVVTSTSDVVAPLAPTVLFGAPVAASPSGPVALEHVGQITSQYHAQDELGQYTFGYSGGPSAKHEVKTADGLTSGGYSYIDSHGLVQTAAYVSDPVNGFRVAATNIPQPRQPEYISDSPEVEEAKQKLFQAQADHIAKL
ncbi:hypothetical protein GE061_015125 [Apolygus lucorum]|uniref:Cuticle protein 6 n=1 Tax=Apolygus lucorum TaxID=248454 RepID=A0A8S9XMA4_APOLU|nr:hypothetical protein GE061_015125 [Apolygus lucorum]